MGIYIYSVANIFEAEQHLTKWTSDLNIPYKRKLLNCRLSSRWITLTFLHIVRLTQTFLLSLCFWLYSSIWENHCTTGHFSSDYSQTNHRQFSLHLVSVQWTARLTTFSLIDEEKNIDCCFINDLNQKSKLAQHVILALMIFCYHGDYRIVWLMIYCT